MVEIVNQEHPWHHLFLLQDWQEKWIIFLKQLQILIWPFNAASIYANKIELRWKSLWRHWASSFISHSHVNSNQMYLWHIHMLSVLRKDLVNQIWNLRSNNLVNLSLIVCSHSRQMKPDTDQDQWKQKTFWMMWHSLVKTEICKYKLMTKKSTQSTTKIRHIQRSDIDIFWFMMMDRTHNCSQKNRCKDQILLSKIMLHSENLPQNGCCTEQKLRWMEMKLMMSIIAPSTRPGTRFLYRKINKMHMM